MSTQQFRLEYLQNIRVFIGNRSVLTEFITTSGMLINQSYDVNNVNDFQNVLFFKSIKSHNDDNAKISFNRKLSKTCSKIFF